MNYFKIGLLLFTILSLAVSQLVLPQTAEAATLYYSPSSANLTVDQTWTTKVMVSTTESTAAIKYTVVFPSNILSVVTANCGARFSTTISTTIGNGTISGDCAALGQGNAYTGTAGEVAVITFKAKAAGTGNLSFGVSTVVRNGGDFGNMYTGGGSASVSVSSAASSTPPPSTSQPQTGAPAPTKAQTSTQSQPTGTATPVISSPTHADQEKWYKERKIDLAWTKTAQEFTYAIDQTPNTQLPQQVKDGAVTMSQTVTGDGVWYAHVRAKSDKGWSNTAHFKVQIDGSAPTSPAIKTEPTSPMKVLPTVSFSAEDSVSGVDYFEIKLDDGSWQRMESPFKPSQIASGEHTIAVRVVDKAGNAAESKAVFTIVPLATPVITSLGEGLLMLGEKFTIAGTAPADTTVEIYINGEKRETVTVDKNGKFSSKEEYLLFPGAYKVTAKAVNTDGITSPMSEAKQVTIDARAVSVLGLVLPGWGVFGLGGLIIVLLLIALLWLAYRLWMQSHAWASRLGMVGKNLDKDFIQLENELVAVVDASLANKDPQTAATIKADIAKQIDLVEDEVEAKLKQAGSAGFEVTARDSKAVVPILLKNLSAIWTIALQGKDNLIGKIVRLKPIQKNSVQSMSKESKISAEAEVTSDKPETTITPEMKKTLTELEQKAEGRSTDDEQSVIPEIGDILAPEKEAE